MANDLYGLVPDFAPFLTAKRSILSEGMPNRAWLLPLTLALSPPKIDSIVWGGTAAWAERESMVDVRPYLRADFLRPGKTKNENSTQ
jgi:hypothetical protein